MLIFDIVLEMTGLKLKKYLTLLNAQKETNNSEIGKMELGSSKLFIHYVKLAPIRVGHY